MQREKDQAAPLQQDSVSTNIAGSDGAYDLPGKADATSESAPGLKRIRAFFAAQGTGEEAAACSDLNHVVHRMLLIGLGTSTAVIFAGLAFSIALHRRIPSRVDDIGTLYSGLRSWEPGSLLSLGILLLIVTPVLRVLGSLVEFIVKRDWHFAFVTAAVALILGISVFFGQG